eukprot:TRINITY_DN3470_c0_g1_i1.p1 TRINITY_DN3470_c0_g1~~TRINITY_DN3470_c0_g1_i1.p1  ORF type:complete len:851 (+),score=171.46 TRINITY_DN3470_c0_g1_i1:75-2627(+)
MLRAVLNASRVAPRLARFASSNTAGKLLIGNAFRRWGYLNANVDPLGRMSSPTVAQLQPETYGQKSDAYVDSLKKAYCGNIAAQFDHMENRAAADWVAQRLEALPSQTVSNDERKRALELMVEAESFDHFMAKKFGNVKRYGLEGCEALIPALDKLFGSAASSGVKDMVLTMPHRGRLNFLVSLLNFPSRVMFQKAGGKPEFDLSFGGVGDVLSHLGISTTVQDSLYVSFIQNPSHLEAGSPVAMGKARARQDQGKPNTMCVMVHGDASFPGQGVDAETAHMSKLPAYTVGGTVHVIVNNQVGFTTTPNHGRSSRFSGDLLKINDSPIFAVNAESPESVLQVMQLAVEYQQKFKSDVVVELIGYRRHGHNELDEPAFTQPSMYQCIRSRKTSPALYAEQLVKEGVVSEAETQAVRAKFDSHYEAEFQAAQTHKPTTDSLGGKWANMTNGLHANAAAAVDTGVDIETLKDVARASVTLPAGFVAHERLQRSHIDARLKRITSDQHDWATAEAMAWGSLLKQGCDIRISGQDVGRGTFSHRHALLTDAADKTCIPLNALGGGKLHIANSPLSEFAVMCYEYGYSIESPQSLVLWEAQFGDFANGAQIAIDQFLGSSEDKWFRQTALTLLLPHGMDGAGPEHSSCRLERFLQLCDAPFQRDSGLSNRTNMHVANPTTPANYFHLLRRQMIRPFRKPLVVAGPKTLLRDPRAVSSVNDMAPGTSFKPVIGDDYAEAGAVKRVLLCSGKLYYDLDKARRGAQRKDVALVRVEELVPFPYDAIEAELQKFNASEIVWVQEEHQNQGAYSFVAPRLQSLVQGAVQYIGRAPASVPAVGTSGVHKKENEALFSAALRQ